MSWKPVGWPIRPIELVSRRAARWRSVGRGCCAGVRPLGCGSHDLRGVSGHDRGDLFGVEAVRPRPEVVELAEEVDVELRQSRLHSGRQLQWALLLSRDRQRIVHGVSQPRGLARGGATPVGRRGGRLAIHDVDHRQLPYRDRTCKVEPMTELFGGRDLDGRDVDNSLWRQYGRAIDVLDSAMRDCPDELWGKSIWEVKLHHPGVWPVDGR